MDRTILGGVDGSKKIVYQMIGVFEGCRPCVNKALLGFLAKARRTMVDSTQAAPKVGVIEMTDTASIELLKLSVRVNTAFIGQAPTERTNQSFKALFRSPLGIGTVHLWTGGGRGGVEAGRVRRTKRW